MMIGIVVGLLLAALAVVLIVQNVTAGRDRASELFGRLNRLNRPTSKNIMDKYSEAIPYGSAAEVSEWVRDIPYGMSYSGLGLVLTVFQNFLTEQKIGFDTEPQMLRYPCLVLLQEAYIVVKDQSIKLENLDVKSGCPPKVMPMAQALIEHLINVYVLEVSLDKVRQFMHIFNPGAILNIEQAIFIKTTVPPKAASHIENLGICNELDPYFAKVRDAVVSGCADKCSNGAPSS